MKTTFEKIKSFGPCKDGWHKLLNYYNPRTPDQEITFKEIIESNGLDDAIWALRTIEDRKSVLLFCTDVAELVLPFYENQFPGNKRIRDGIEACRLYVNGKVTKEELEIKKDELWGMYAQTQWRYAEPIKVVACAVDSALSTTRVTMNQYVMDVVSDTVTVTCQNTDDIIIAEQNKINEITTIFLKYF